MGNYTDIEKEFESIIQPKINGILALNPNNTPQRQQQINATISQELFLLRTRKMNDLSSFTERNVICYFSAFLQSSIANPELSINDNDINGFMNAISGMDKSKGLDLILHTPGGGVTATESIVTYLRKIFKMDIRVIVPHMAMSAGTMIACSSKEIVMGKQSSLGPIDPQYHNVPAQGVLKEFERAIAETQTVPNRALIWKEIIKQYRPTFIGECENAVKMSYDLVSGWLADCMFKGYKSTKRTRIENVLNELSSHDASKLHDRHYDFEKCKKLGLKVTALESNSDFQDKVLSLYHSYLLSIYRLPSSLKYIECQRGQTFVINGKRNP